jgi:hypothetical protein
MLSESQVVYKCKADKKRQRLFPLPSYQINVVIPADTMLIIRLMLCVGRNISKRALSSIRTILRRGSSSLLVPYVKGSRIYLLQRCLQSSWTLSNFLLVLDHAKRPTAEEALQHPPLEAGVEDIITGA